MWSASAPTCSTAPIASSVRVYVDSSALIKRSINETESDALEAVLAAYAADEAALMSSSLAWIEVGRALRALDSATSDPVDVGEAVVETLSGVAERPITADVVSLARRVAPPTLRTLDAIHLATAILLDADVVLTYDKRLASACRYNDLTTVAPGW